MTWNHIFLCLTARGVSMPARNGSCYFPFSPPLIHNQIHYNSNCGFYNIFLIFLLFFTQSYKVFPSAAALRINSSFAGAPSFVQKSTYHSSIARNSSNSSFCRRLISSSAPISSKSKSPSCFIVSKYTSPLSSKPTRKVQFLYSAI